MITNAKLFVMGAAGGTSYLTALVMSFACASRMDTTTAKGDGMLVCANSLAMTTDSGGVRTDAVAVMTTDGGGALRMRLGKLKTDQQNDAQDGQHLDADETHVVAS